MNKSRNTKNKSNSESEQDLDLYNNSDLDDQFHKNNDSDEDFSDNSDLSDEIEKKIDSIVYEKNKGNRKNSGKDENNFFGSGGKDEKKKKEKYEKKIMKENWADYFEASHNKIEDYYQVNYPELNKYDLKIDLYTDFYKLIEKKEVFSSFLESKTKSKFKGKKKDEEDDKEKEIEINNDINMGNLFSLMYELIYQNINVFLCGFGSKMNLIYDFIKYYQEKFSDDCNDTLYIISCNLNNPEMTMKVIINKIQSCLMLEFEKYIGKENNETKFSMESTMHSQIEKIQKIYNAIEKKYEKRNNKKNDDDNKNEKDSSLEEEEENNNEEEEKNYKKEKDEEEIFLDDGNDLEEYIPFQILLVIHNIGSINGQSKLFQENLSEIANKLNFVNLVVTCENLTIPYYWTSEVKDKFRFCFLKFNTFDPYDAEIDENNSIKGGYSLKGGDGLREIFSSFTENQKKLIKEIAKLTLENNYDKLTQKGLVNHIVEKGIGIATTIQKLEELLLEAVDHEIITLKLCSVNNKEIYKINLDRSVIEKIVQGEYM